MSEYIFLINTKLLINPTVPVTKKNTALPIIIYPKYSTVLETLVMLRSLK